MPFGAFSHTTPHSFSFSPFAQGDYFFAGRLAFRGRAAISQGVSRDIFGLTLSAKKRQPCRRHSIKPKEPHTRRFIDECQIIDSF